MDKTRIYEHYEKLDSDALIKEKGVQQAKKEDAFKRHEDAANKMTSGIVMAATGLVFIWLLPASIPLLVIGIPKIVRSAKERHAINDEYEEAVYRLSSLDEIMEGKDVKVTPEEVEGEVLDAEKAD